MRHHAFAIEAPREEGITRALEYLERELGMRGAGNPDIVILAHGLLSAEDARAAAVRALSAPLAGTHKAVIIAATRAYHEAQNALLKLFEEPPPGVVLFFIMPALGGLLPTLRSRVHILKHVGPTRSHMPETTREFMSGGKEKRAAIIKKLASGQDDEARREARDTALALVNSIESIAYARFHVGHSMSYMSIGKLLEEITVLRGYLHDRGAPLKQILEHLALVVPADLL